MQNQYLYTKVNFKKCLDLFHKIVLIMLLLSYMSTDMT